MNPSSSVISDAAERLSRELGPLLGSEHVLTDEQDLRFFSQDIAGIAQQASCVIAPGSVDELARAIAMITTAGFAIVPRGGGASYTGGYHADRVRSVIVDTRRLRRIVEVNTADACVTVECGCTWQALEAALRPHGVRTPFWGPLSGAVATVGGSLSQHAILWGSARHGVSAESVLALDVVLANGSLVSTGSAAIRGGRPFFRHYGPDLSGVFLGDAGALGVKARATLKLIRRPTVVETASFSFDTHAALTAAMTDVARADLVSECLGMDPVLQRQRLKRAGLVSDRKAVSGVISSSRSIGTRIREAARVAAAGRRFLDDISYSMHVGAEGRNAATVAAALGEVRSIVTGSGGREIENSMPKALRSKPFVPMSSAIGPQGERWLPVHAVLRLSDALAAWSAVQAMLAEYQAAFDRCGVVVGVLTAIVAGSAFVLEPVFYWPAPRTLYYERVLDTATLARLQSFPPNPAAESLVFEVRGRLARLFLERGATHLQIGRTYLYHEGLKPEARALIDSIKQAVDPRGLMNPGALGLGG